MGSPGSYTVAKRHSFTQATPSTQWDIEYPVSFVPVVDVMIINPDTGNLEKILPMSIERITNNHLRISFSVPYAGNAILVG